MQKTQQQNRVNNAPANRVRKQLTPLEQLQRADEAFQHALTAKKMTLLEMYGDQGRVEKLKNDVRKVSTTTPVQPKDLAMAAVVQAHTLLEAIYDGTKLEETKSDSSKKPPTAAAKCPPSTGSPRKTSSTVSSVTKTEQIPSVSCSQLACIAAPLMKCLTALSQSCTILERELKEKTKELEELKSKVVINVEKPTDPSPKPSPQRQVSRPSDLPLRQRHQVPQPAQNLLASKKDSVANEAMVDVVRKSCLLSASPTPAQGPDQLASEENPSNVMSKSLPASLMSDGKADEDGEEEQRRKRSLQKRWRNVMGNVDFDGKCDGKK